MPPSPTCTVHGDITHEYFDQAWRRWDYMTFHTSFTEAGDRGRGIHAGRKLLQKLQVACDFECFGNNQRRKAREILENLDQVQQSLPYLAIVREERPF